MKQSHAGMRWLFIFVVIIMVSAIAWLAFGRSNASTSTDSNANGSITYNDDGAAKKLVFNQTGATIVVDGWSWHTLGGSALEYRGAKAATKLPFRAGTRDDVDTLLAQDPSTVTKLLARLVTGEANVACTKTGCTINGKDFDLNGLVNPQSVEGWGDVYKEWGIQYGFEVAVIPLNTDITVAVGNDNWQPYEVTLAQNAVGPAAQPDIGPDGKPLPLPDYVANPAKNPNVFVLGAAFGRIFTLDPLWVQYTADGKAVNTPQTAAARQLVTDYSGDINALGGVGPFTKGLGDKVVTSTGLTESQLTYMSSPTTGCGVGVLCVPTIANNTVTSGEVSRAQMCDTTISANSTPGAKVTVPAQVALVTRDEVWLVRYPNATSQDGVWDGNAPVGSGAALGIWTPGAPPTVKGSVKLHVKTFAVYDSTNQLLSLSGDLYQIGVDKNNTAKWDVAAATSGLNGRYTACAAKQGPISGDNLQPGTPIPEGGQPPAAQPDSGGPTPDELNKYIEQNKNHPPVPDAPVGETPATPPVEQAP